MSRDNVAYPPARRARCLVGLGIHLRLFVSAIVHGTQVIFIKRKAHGAVEFGWPTQRFRFKCVSRGKH